MHKAKSCHQLFLPRLRRLIALCVNSCAEIRRQRICQRFYYEWKKSNQKVYNLHTKGNLHWWCLTGLNFQFPHQLLLTFGQVSNGNQKSKKNRIFKNIYVSLRLRVQNTVSPQPCVGKFRISLVLLNFLHCNFRLWFETP